MNSSGAVGDIIAFTFVSFRDNTVYTKNRKHIGLVIVIVVVLVKKTFFNVLRRGMFTTENIRNIMQNKNIIFIISIINY